MKKKRILKRGKRDSLAFYKIISGVAIVVAFLAVFMLYMEKSGVEAPVLLPISELSTQGYTGVKVDVSTAGNVGLVVIEGDCYRMTASTELYQTESIANGINQKISFRPNTHDLIRDAMESMNINVLMVKVVDIQNNTFVGRLILKQGDQIVSLDSRPSDGIAVAVRTGAPIYIKDDLLKQYGSYVC